MKNIPIEPLVIYAGGELARIIETYEGIDPICSKLAEMYKFFEWSTARRKDWTEEEKEQFQKILNCRKHYKACNKNNQFVVVINNGLPTLVSDRLGHRKVDESVLQDCKYPDHQGKVIRGRSGVQIVYHEGEKYTVDFKRGNVEKLDWIDFEVAGCREWEEFL